MMMMIDTPFY